LALDQLQAAEAGLKDLTVLMVDDNPNMLKVMQTLFKALQITHFYEATSAEGAIALMKDITFDVIVTDLAMKPVDGIELVRALRTHPQSPAPRIPILMLTGHTDAKVVMRARDVGINDFLAKPVSVNMLRDRLTRVVRDSRPFVKADSYVGPERRAERKRDYSGPERRKGRIEPRTETPFFKPGQD
jgi:two-component system chemotaxis response regulator CheY